MMNGKPESSPDSVGLAGGLSSRESLSHPEENALSQTVQQLTLTTPAIRKDPFTEAHENGNEKSNSLCKSNQATEMRNKSSNDRSHLTLPTTNVTLNGISSSSSLNHLHSTRNVHAVTKLHSDDFYQQKRIREAISPSPHRSEINRAQLKSDALAEVSQCYRGILASVGEDIKRHGLLKTPERAAKAMLYFTKGYDENVSGQRGLRWPLKKCQFVKEFLVI